MKLIILFIFLGGFAAFSKEEEQLTNNGNEVGNGGDVILYTDGRLEILDLFEAKENFQLSLLEMNKSNSSVDFDGVISNAKLIIKKLESLMPSFANKLIIRLETMKPEIIFKSNVKLMNLEDSKHLTLPKDAVLDQICVREEVEGKVKFIIQEEYWNKLDSLNRTALIVHELLYEYLVFFGEKNSIKARRLTGLLLSKDFDKYNEQNLRELFQRNQLPIYF